MTELNDAPVYDNAAARFEEVRLDWPFTFEGRRYETITVRRMTMKDVSAFVAKAKEAGPGALVHYPMFDVPDEVLDLLDPDDDDRVSEVVERFLPRRFRSSSAPSVPATGGE